MMSRLLLVVFVLLVVVFFVLWLVSFVGAFEATAVSVVMPTVEIDDSLDWSCTFLPVIGGYLDQGFVNEDLPGGGVVPVVPDALCVERYVIVPTVIPTVEATAVPTVIPTVEATAVPTVTPTVGATAVPTVTPTPCDDDDDDGECDDD
jgi:hypothetical protein